MNNAALTSIWRKRIYNFYIKFVPKYLNSKNFLIISNLEDLNQLNKNINNAENIKKYQELEYLFIIPCIADINNLIIFLRRLSETLSMDVKIIFLNYNIIWTPIFKITSFFRLTRSREKINFFREKDMEVFLKMTGWEKIRIVKSFILPIKIPLISFIFDNLIFRLPFLRFFSLCNIYFIRRNDNSFIGDKSVSILIPCKNEEGNIGNIIKQLSKIGKKTQVIFIDDKSTDNTNKLIVENLNLKKDINIDLVLGLGRGKAEAIISGMKIAKGDLCMILDADLAVLPEDLQNFYYSMTHRFADFMHGTRFIFNPEKNSVRFFNLIGNKFFAKFFSFIIDQRTTDTLCGTKVFWKKDWQKFSEMRTNLNNLDQWGDFDLIFGASYFGLKVSQLPVRYYPRLYGASKMNKRFSNGFVMLKVCFLALFKIKFIGD